MNIDGHSKKSDFRYRATFMFAIAMVLVLSTILPAIAGDSTRIQIGTTEIVFPVPNGFSDPSQRAPRINATVEALTVPQKRFLVMFASEQDIELVAVDRDPKMALYYVAQTFRQTESATLSIDLFKNTKQIIREQFMTLSPMSTSVLQTVLQNFLSERGASSGTVTVKPLGVFDETEHSISATNITTATAKSGDVAISDSTVVSITTAMIHGKFVYLQVCSDLSGAEDVLSNQKASREWTRAILSANE
jgi:hypothetical protein